MSYNKQDSPLLIKNFISKSLGRGLSFKRVEISEQSRKKLEEEIFAITRQAVEEWVIDKQKNGENTRCNTIKNEPKGQERKFDALFFNNYTVKIKKTLSRAAILEKLKMLVAFKYRRLRVRRKKPILFWIERFARKKVKKSKSFLVLIKKLIKKNRLLIPLEKRPFIKIAFDTFWHISKNVRRVTVSSLMKRIHGPRPEKKFLSVMKTKRRKKSIRVQFKIVKGRNIFRQRRKWKAHRYVKFKFFLKYKWLKKEKKNPRKKAKFHLKTRKRDSIMLKKYFLREYCLKPEIFKLPYEKYKSVYTRNLILYLIHFPYVRNMYRSHSLIKNGDVLVNGIVPKNLILQNYDVVSFKTKKEVWGRVNEKKKYPWRAGVLYSGRKNFFIMMPRFDDVTATKQIKKISKSSFSYYTYRLLNKM